MLEYMCKVNKIKKEVIVMKEFDILRQKMLDYRAKHNISQQKFAELCKLTVQTVCNIENGVQEPSKLTKQKILNVIEKEN